MAKKMVPVFVLFLVVGFVTNCNTASFVGTTWVNQDNGNSLSFSSETQVVITISGNAVPATYSVVDGTVTMSAGLDSIVGKVDANKIIITGELLGGEIFTKK
jgi:hypothetical protein